MEISSKKTKILGRPIRLLPPSKCEPFFYGKIVGVGESIGTVFSLYAGEGIIPSLQCCDIFIENMYDFERYRRAVLQHFQIFDDVGELLTSLLSNKFTFPDDIFRMGKVVDEINRNQKEIWCLLFIQKSSSVSTLNSIYPQRI